MKKNKTPFNNELLQDYEGNALAELPLNLSLVQKTKGAKEDNQEDEKPNGQKEGKKKKVELTKRAPKKRYGQKSATCHPFYKPIILIKL